VNTGELEEEEADLPAPHETLVERSHRDFGDTKEHLKTAAHIKGIIWSYVLGHTFMSNASTVSNSYWVFDTGPAFP
jgi:hypothetical protein